MISKMFILVSWILCGFGAWGPLPPKRRERGGNAAGIPLSLQPGSHGADMFLQPHASWRKEVNFIHPPSPAIGRVLTFLPSVAARAIVVLPMSHVKEQWWVNWTRVGGPGVLDAVTSHQFLLVVVDHSRRYITAPPQPHRLSATWALYPIT